MVELARRGPTIAATAWLKTLPPMHRFSFNGDARARAAALPVWGVGFSEEACRAHAHATRATLWLGPDEYLLLDFGGGENIAGAPTPASATAAIGAATATLETLERALADVPHSLVDVGHRQFALQLSGAHAATILNAACPLDLNLSEFPVGMCTRTVLAKADIVLWRTGEEGFHLEVWRSFAGYVTGLLREVATEFYPPVSCSIVVVDRHFGS